MLRSRALAAILAEGTISREQAKVVWEEMLASGREYILRAPWVGAFPGMAIFVMVLGLNLLGDGLRDALDPKLK